MKLEDELWNRDRRGELEEQNLGVCEKCGLLSLAVTPRDTCAALQPHADIRCLPPSSRASR